MSAPQDDADREVSSLASPWSSPPAGRGHDGAPRLSGAAGDAELPAQGDRRVSPTARRSWRQQAVRAGSAVLLFTLLLCGILLLPSGNRAAILRALIPLIPPTP